MTIKLAVLVVFGLLTGCTATYVTNEAVESNKGVEAGANAILVTNILRARDGLTPYYSDISHLRGSLQAQATVSAAAAFGAYDVTHWTGRDLANPGASVQVNPSFDIAPLNTSDFTKGINEPIDIRVFQYYLDRAIPPYLLLQLFVDKIEDVSYDGRRAVIRAYYNLPCDDSSPNCGLINKETGERYFDAKIRSWIHPYLFLHAYKLLTPYGPPITIASSGNEEPKLKDFPGVANANLLLRPVGDGTGAYRFYMASDSIAFCVAADRATKPRQGALAVTVKNQDGSIEAIQSYQVIRIARNTVGSSAATTSESVDPSACIKKEVFADLGVSSQKTDSYTSIHFRSVDGMVEFLGRMLRVSPQLRPLKFDISADDSGSSRITVNYLGHDYYVHDRHRTIPDQTGCSDSVGDARCEDKTLEILTLVTSLFNLNKSQKDLPSTAAVQVVN